MSGKISSALHHFFGKSRDGGKAIGHYRKLAEKGDADAQFYLGYLYEEGEKLDQDPAEMVKWYGLAAAQGHTEAEYRLGLCCYYGIGMEKDPAKAAEWFRRAAEK